MVGFDLVWDWTGIEHAITCAVNSCVQMPRCICKMYLLSCSYPLPLTHTISGPSLPESLEEEGGTHAPLQLNILQSLILCTLSSCGSLCW